MRQHPQSTLVNEQGHRSWMESPVHEVPRKESKFEAIPELFFGSEGMDLLVNFVRHCFRRTPRERPMIHVCETEPTASPAPKRITSALSQSYLLGAARSSFPSWGLLRGVMFHTKENTRTIDLRKAQGRTTFKLRMMARRLACYHNRFCCTVISYSRRRKGHVWVFLGRACLVSDAYCRA